MAIRALHHVQLAMPPGGEAEARRFYAGVLGIPEVSKPQPLAARGGCWFESGELRLHLGVKQDFRPAKKAHPALAVTDLDGLRARLQENGIALQEAEVLGEQRRGFVEDPFGNRVELIEQRGAGFAVLYRWKLKPERIDDFRDAWAAATHRIRAERGGLGSRLHQSSDGWWAAYAQWPSRETWLASQDQGAVDASLSARMQAAILESKPALELTGVHDLLEALLLEAGEVARR
ncbi:MAG: hypothetical protein CMJ94_11540 [Planctomycetes bacterium]|nr:hypothetical protein [Planctomycetota bacterium]